MAIKGTYTESELKGIIGNLYQTIGVRMEIQDSIDHLSFTEKDFVAVCEVVTRHMELPVAVVPDFSSLFNRSKLVQHDDGTSSGMSARITIPGNLPAYGTKELVGFPIRVELSGEALDNRYIVLTQMSHEFSHLYLYSRRDPLKSSEHATDLCALMMGFDTFWRKGRKTKRGRVITTQGYLSDDEYNLAVRCISALRKPFSAKHERVKTIVKDIRNMCTRVRGRIEAFYTLLTRVRGAKRASDAAKLSAITDKAYRDNLNARLNRRVEQTNRAVDTINSKKAFYERDKAWLDDCTKVLSHYLDDLNSLYRQVSEDIAILSRNV